MDNHRELLRVWLRGKNIHIADVRSALEWFDEELAAGRSPEDKEVLEKAEEAHREAIVATAPRIVEKEVIVEKAVDHYVPVPFIDLNKIRDKILVYSFSGTGAALVLYEVVKWVLAMTLLA